MLVLEQNFPEEWTAGAEDHFVGHQLLLSLAMTLAIATICLDNLLAKERSDELSAT